MVEGYDSGRHTRKSTVLEAVAASGDTRGTARHAAVGAHFPTGDAARTAAVGARFPTGDAAHAAELQSRAIRSGPYGPAGWHEPTDGQTAARTLTT